MAESPDSTPKVNEDEATKPWPPPPPTAGQTPPPSPTNGPTLAEVDASPGLTLEVEDEPEWRKTAGAMTSELGDWSLFVRRSLRSDFYQERATDAERQRLAVAELPVETELAQDYAAWRRGMLWMAVIAMVVAFVFGLIEAIDTLFTTGMPGIVRFLAVVLFAAQVFATVLVTMAALQWSNLPKSKRLSRYAWLVLFFGPIAVFLLPIPLFVSSYQRPQMAIGMAVMVPLYLFPKIIGLFAGMIRSGLTLKTLFPESSTPGWVAVIVAPLYVLFFLVALVAAIQSTISIWLVMAFLAFIVSPILLLLKTSKLMQPMEPEQGHQVVAGIRRSSSICVVLAFVFFMIFAFSSIKEISFWSVLSGITGFVTSVLLLTLVMSDLMVSLLIQSFAQSQAFRESDMEEKLGAKYAEFSSVGLAELDMGEKEVFKKLGGVAKFANFVGKELVSGGAKGDEESGVGKSESVESESNNPMENK